MLKLEDLKKGDEIEFINDWSKYQFIGKCLFIGVNKDNKWIVDNCMSEAGTFTIYSVGNMGLCVSHNANSAFATGIFTPDLRFFKLVEKKGLKLEHVKIDSELKFTSEKAKEAFMALYSSKKLIKGCLNQDSFKVRYVGRYISAIGTGHFSFKINPTEYHLFELVEEKKGLKVGEIKLEVNVDVEVNVKSKDSKPAPTRHKNADMIIAMANDTSLVVLFKDSVNRWHKNKDSFVLYELECYLCHPKHVKACLHWLNGGNVLFLDTVPKSSYEGRVPWTCNSIFMCGDNKIKISQISQISPKKEKRWIVYNSKTNEVFDCERTQTPAEGFQKKEIEVEV